MEKQINALRRQQHILETSIRRAVQLVDDTTVKEPENYTEVKEQLMLAVRHMEDSRMRLGKALQYMGNGVSVFDGPTDQGAEPLMHVQV